MKKFEFHLKKKKKKKKEKCLTDMNMPQYVVHSSVRVTIFGVLYTSLSLNQISEKCCLFVNISYWESNHVSRFLFHSIYHLKGAELWEFGIISRAPKFFWITRNRKIML